MSDAHLVERFAEAGLELQLADSPIANGRGAEHIFQMDIRRKRARDPHSEYFVGWMGKRDNLAVIQGVDRRERQLVLMVHEPKREFLVAVPRGIMRETCGDPAMVATRAGVSVKDIRVRGDQAWVVRATPARKRHFLAGCDERQLFMCRLPRACTTVRQAHEALRVPMANHERSAIDRAVRQGEWFFVVLSDRELADLAGVTVQSAMVRRKVSIGRFIPRAGKPHVADELIAIAPPSAEGRDEPTVYVRGSVRHVDHRTIHFAQWRRVFRNREVDEGRALFGGTWID